MMSYHQANEVQGFSHGLADGLSDFFLKPIEGAQKEGVLGFGKGKSFIPTPPFLTSRSNLCCRLRQGHR
jgi:hypothetical protein